MIAEFIGFIVGMLVVFIFVVLVMLVFFIFKAVALYTMAQRRGIDNAWLAFIPIAQLYIQGAVTGEVNLFNTKLDTKVVLPAAAGAALVLSWIPVIGNLIPIAYTVFYFIALHKLYNDRRPESAVIYLVVSILFNVVAEAFIFWSLRNEDSSDGFYK